MEIVLTGGTMLLSVIAYGLRYGWWYGIGFVLSIFFHEMGHFIAAKQRGLDVGMPMFIPFVGAAVQLKDQPHDVETEAYVSIAGPVAGTLAAIACYFAYVFWQSNLLLALAFAGFMINLFNLIPISPLDGGRITAIISRKVWWLGVPILVSLFVWNGSPMFLLIVVLALPQLWPTKEQENALPERYYDVALTTRLNYAIYYFVLAAFLGVMSHHTYRLIEPTFAGIHYNLGATLQTKGDLEGAIAEYRAALRLNPGHVDAHNNLGATLQAKGDLEGAIAEYRTALRLNPDHVNTHQNLGSALFVLGERLRAKWDIEGAIAEYHAALRHNPDHVDTHINLGATLQNKGDLEGAIAEYRAVLHLNPDHVTAHYNLGTALETKGDLEGAVAEYRAVLHLDPDHVKSHLYLGNALFVLGARLQAKGDLEGAIVEYRAALHYHPDHVNAHYNLGIALKDIGDATAAKKELEEFLRLAPDTPKYQGTIAYAKKILTELK